jgi:type IV pilus assembly protein PilW
MLIRRGAMGRHRQAGLSIVELLVGVAIGLVIVAGSSVLMTGQLIENRKLLIETQLQQDLRAAADIVTRELRRAGAVQEPTALRTIWYPGTAQVESNAMAAGLSFSAAQVNFDYDPGLTSGPYGFRLVTTTSPPTGVIQTRIGASGWQDLTDPKVMRVTTFTPTAVVVAPPVRLPCPKLCADGTSDCWPTYQVRELLVTIEAEALADSTVKRAITTRARVRNDLVNFFDPALSRMCPA